MPGDIAGLPYWPVTFDERGALVAPDSRLEADLPASGVTDLLVFSHGWNNQADEAEQLYRSVFGLLPGVIDRVPLRAGVSLGLVGVHWPSILFPDSAPLGTPPRTTDGTALTDAIAPAFPGQQTTLTEIGALLNNKPADPADLHHFSDLLARLVTSPATSPEDAGEQDLLSGDPLSVFGHLATLSPTTNITDTQALPNPFHLLWHGATEALRAASYYEMKRRAGVVGQAGLGPLITRVAAGRPGLRVHLMGHSFGARLVAYALTGLNNPPPSDSPIKAMLLVQGAFSHFSFAAALPFDPRRAGGLAHTQNLIDGPLLATFTAFDLAVGRLYPAASLISNTDSEGLDDLLYRWGGMGHDGYQGVDAATVPLTAVGDTYTFTANRFYNLDSNRIIATGPPPSGAHSDIVHPEIAYAMLAAAGILASR
jgi:hypothetical protein